MQVGEFETVVARGERIARHAAAGEISLAMRLPLAISATIRSYAA
jgi:hypothetical protein